MKNLAVTAHRPRIPVRRPLRRSRVYRTEGLASLANLGLSARILLGFEVGVLLGIY